jgi:endonuclease I
MKKLNLKNIVLYWIFFNSILINAQIPAYYSSIDFTKTGEELKNQIANLITTTHHTTLPYTSSSQDTWDAIYQTDENPMDNQKVKLIYGWDDVDVSHTNDYSRLKTFSCHTSSCSGFWVREHVYARSWGTPALGFEQAGADVHNLRSIDNEWNNTRSNKIFEDATPQIFSYTTNNGNWFPGNEWCGDVARIIMYMYLRYPNQCKAAVAGMGSKSFSPLQDMPDVFLKWNTIDPPSIYEQNRNSILQNIQGNRNPFIDNPYLAKLIWNGPAPIDTWGQLSIENNIFDSIYIYPSVTNGIINIENSFKNNINYNIYNTLGQLIQSDITINTIDISNNVKGVYFITLQLENQFKKFKIILN